MSERLSEEQLKELVESTPEESVNGRVYRELLDRRAADPTSAQRAWYRDKASEYTDHAIVTKARIAEEIGSEDEDVDDYLVYSVRLATHFGRLALEGDHDGKIS